MKKRRLIEDFFFWNFDIMIVQLKNRFSDSKHLENVALYDLANSKKYAETFSDRAFQQLWKLYGQKFDALKLKPEMKVLCNDLDYVQKNLKEFY